MSESRFPDLLETLVVKRIGGFLLEEVPASVAGERTPDAPLWAIAIAKHRPAFQLKGVGGRVYALMAVQSESEIAALRAAAKATVPAVSWKQVI